MTGSLYESRTRPYRFGTVTVGGTAASSDILKAWLSGCQNKQSYAGLYVSSPTFCFDFLPQIENSDLAITAPFPALQRKAGKDTPLCSNRARIGVRSACSNRITLSRPRCVCGFS